MLKKSDTHSQIYRGHARLWLGRISDPSFSNLCIHTNTPPVNTLVEKEDFSIIIHTHPYAANISAKYLHDQKQTNSVQTFRLLDLKNTNLL